MKKILIILLGSLLSFPAFAGGGWPQKRGGGYLKVSQWWVISDQHYTDVGLIDPNTTFGIFNTSIYAEYGITSRLTGIIYAPLFSRAYFNSTVSGTTGETLIPGEAINSIGDTDVTVKYGLITKGPVVMSASLMLGLPLGISNGGSNGTLQTGDGEFNQMLRIDASTSRTIGKVNTYYSIYAGFNNRTNGFSDEVRYGVEAGATFLGDKLTAIFRAYGINSLKNGTSTEVPNSTSLFANNSEHITLSPEVAYKFTPKMGVSASYAQAVWGNLIFANPAYSVGVFYSW